MSDTNGHDFSGPISGLSFPCVRCGYRMTIVAQMVATIDGKEAEYPPCPGVMTPPKPISRNYYSKPKVCKCSMADLLSTGHNPGCPEKKK